MTIALEIKDLSKTYQNGYQALDHVSFSVEQGDFFALLGPNGAGKSTTLGIVSSLVNKTSGDVKVFGHSLDKELVLAKTCLGVVPQEVNFNQFEKVRDILITQAGYYGIPAKESSVTADSYLKELGLWDKRDQPARMLSGGMKRRLMIARALIHKPKLLILDEPTAGVDVELRRSMWTFLRGINEAGTTIILTTHYLEEAEELCRNIAIIDKGRILENTSMKSLLGKMQKETYVVETEPVLTTLPEIDGFSVELKRNGCLEVEMNKTQTMNELFAAIASQSWHVKSIRSKSNRLEELFLSLVSSGQSLSSEEKA